MTESTTRRQEILDAAAELFAGKGVGGTPIRAIADRVGVVPGALYHHFPSKQAMADELVTEYLENLRTRYRSIDARNLDPRSRLRAIVNASLAAAQENPYATAVYQDELSRLRDVAFHARAGDLADEIQQTWLDTIEDGKRQGTFRGDLPADVFRRLIRDMVWLSIKWHRSDDAYPTSRLAEDCVSIFLDGFAVDRPVAHRADGHGSTHAAA